MATERQIEANRRNAQRSTGPRTAEGKNIVALNAMKHGLLSRESLVKDESEAELVEFGKRMRAQLGPEGELELLLADRIISSAWRLRRVIVVEVAMFQNDRRVDAAFSNYGRQKMAVLSRYEAALERSMYKALHELQRLQAVRAGVPVPAPAVVDVDISGASA